MLTVVEAGLTRKQNIYLERLVILVKTGLRTPEGYIIAMISIVRTYQKTEVSFTHRFRMSIGTVRRSSTEDNEHGLLQSMLLTTRSGTRVSLHGKPTHGVIFLGR